MAKAPKGETAFSEEEAKTSYDEEDPMVRKLFEEALARRGVQSQMEKYYQKNP